MYKVLRRENGKLVSCVIGTFGIKDVDAWIIVYPVNRWKKAKIGKIILCKTLADAKETLKIQQGDEIWQCQTRGTKRFSHLAHIGANNFKIFWEGNMRSLMICPVPTYGADRIKLTKKVWPKEA